MVLKLQASELPDSSLDSSYGRNYDLRKWIDVFLFSWGVKRGAGRWWYSFIVTKKVSWVFRSGWSYIACTDEYVAYTAVTGNVKSNCFHWDGACILYLNLTLTELFLLERPSAFMFFNSIICMYLYTHIHTYVCLCVYIYEIKSCIHD